MSYPVEKGPWIETYSGKPFFLLSDCDSGLDIESIAHALSYQCRFAGHCDRFYSVAEHCVIVSLIVPPELAKGALMHDASEAYLSDIPHPFKPLIEGYDRLESLVMKRVALKYGLPFGFDSDPEFKKYDHSMQHIEAQSIIKSKGSTWTWEPPLDLTGEVERVMGEGYVIGVEPRVAEKMFLARFATLFRGRDYGTAIEGAEE